MRHKRFQDILNCLHLSDINQQKKRGEEGYDKLWGVRPLIEALNRRFASECTLSAHQAIDESMVLFKGRSSLKQYMPLKPIKRGYKIWCRADTETGYLIQF